ncbi:uracil-DNA glycosylase [Synechococcus sp. M16CYN]|uniref:uracil-DNA glycosylase n=1 Tax=Synechococcus sp. M16CYN TaxID=3103139 RepID=UPI00324AB22A
MTASDLNQCLDCSACDLAKTRQTVVLSRGNPDARLMLIGEAPGAQEDQLGIPFVGRSGKVLDRMLSEVGFNLDRDVYICNAIKCRPPNNRRPTKNELAACRSWLDLQIALVDPAVIVLTGSTAVEALLGRRDAMRQLRGQWQFWQGRSVMPVFHPAYLLRHASTDAEGPIELTRRDFTVIRQKLCEL